MRHTSFVLIATLLTCAVTAPSFAGSEDKQHLVFVEFDRVFIPALALTKQEKQGPASKAMQRLSKAWDTRFVNQFAEMFAKDSMWPSDLSQIAQAISRANTELEAGDAQQAHESLEPVRDLLMNARLRNNAEYPLDSLSKFHATMEEIVKPAMKLNVASLTQPKMERFAKLAGQADQEWTRVEQTRFDLAIFGKSEKQRRQFPTMLGAERKAIDQLMDSLSRQDKESILKTARGLKPPFAKVYMFFGDFPEPPQAAR